MIAILTEARWNLGVVLIYVSHMARDDEHFLMSFLAILTSSFEKVLFSSVAHFFISSLVLGEFSFLSSLYILIISPLSDVSLTNIFFHLWVVSSVQKPFLLLFRIFLISGSPIRPSFLLVARLVFY
jgi:hypothetical protein